MFSPRAAVVLVAAFVLLHSAASTVTGAKTPRTWRLLQTTDIHGWIDAHPHNKTYNADFGDFVSFMIHSRYNALLNNEELLLLDSGDLIQGTGISCLTPFDGEYIFPVATNISYNAMTIGNHDIANSDEGLTYMRNKFIPHWNGSYVTSNALWKDTQEPMGGTYYHVETTQIGAKVLYLGYIYDFDQGNKNMTVVVDVEESVKQPYFAQAMQDASDCDMIVVVCHIAPQQPQPLATILQAIRALQPTIAVAFMAGHRHVNYFAWLDKNAFVIESGCYFFQLGQMTFKTDENGQIQDFSYSFQDASRNNFMSLTGTTETTFDTVYGQEVSKQIAAYADTLDLNLTIGCSSDTWMLNAPMDQPNALYLFLMTEVAPKALFPAHTDLPQFYISSTGFLRYNIYQGKVDRNDLWTTLPFNKSFSYFPAVQGKWIPPLLTCLDATPPLTAPWVDWAPPGQLPPWVSNPRVTVDPNTVYDIVANVYDAVAMNICLQKMNTSLPAPIPYLNPTTDTDMLKTYFLDFTTCSASCPCDEGARTRERVALKRKQEQQRLELQMPMQSLPQVLPLASLSTPEHVTTGPASGTAPGGGDEGQAVHVRRRKRMIRGGKSPV